MSENNHPINEVLQTTMNKIREMVDANTVVGQPITTQDGVTLIPVSRLSFGFATGGSDFGKTQNELRRRRRSWRQRVSCGLPGRQGWERAAAACGASSGGHRQPGGGPGARDV